MKLLEIYRKLVCHKDKFEKVNISYDGTLKISFYLYFVCRTFTIIEQKDDTFIFKIDDESNLKNLITSNHKELIVTYEVLYKYLFKTFFKIEN